LPEAIPTSDTNIEEYKGLFKVPSLRAIQKTVGGATIAKQVEHFAQYGIALEIDDWAYDRGGTHETYGALYGLDQMAQKYPEAFKGLKVRIERGNARDELGLFAWPSPANGPDRVMVINVHSRYALGPRATPIQYRRLYAAIVIHETAHMLTYDAVGRDRKAMLSLAKDDRPQQVGGQTLTKGSLRQSVSEYGTSSIGEDIAESFTAHTLGIEITDPVRKEWMAQHLKAIAASGAARRDAIAYLYAIAVTEEDEETSATASALIELACRSAACAPPPVGTGGSEQGSGSASDLTTDGAARSVVSDIEQRYRSMRGESVDRLYAMRRWMLTEGNGVWSDVAYQRGVDRFRDDPDEVRRLLAPPRGTDPNLLDALTRGVRSTISATLRSENPDPEIAKLIVDTYDATQEVLAGRGMKLSRGGASPEQARGEVGNPAGTYGGPGRTLDPGRSGVTSWVVGYDNALDWGPFPHTEVIPAERILMREGVINNEMLVMKSPEIIERLRRGEYPASGPSATTASADANIIELACRSAECAPPPVGTGGSLSTRVVTGVKGVKKLQGQGTRLSEIPVAVAQKQAARLVSNAPGFADLLSMPGMDEESSEEDQKALVDAVVDRIADNVVEVFDRSSSKTRSVSRKWYDAANALAQDLGERGDVHKDAAAAVIAVLSPQQDWDQNVAMAERVIDVMSDPEQRLSGADVMRINGAKVAQWVGAMDTWKSSLAKAEATGDPKKIAEVAAGRPEMSPYLTHSDDLRLSDLSDRDAAFFIRSSSADATVRAISPTAEGGYVMGEPLVTQQGELAKLPWNSYGTITKAVSIMRNPSPENVSAQLGSEHKVRSFYNNIAYPNDAQVDVTLDSHAFGVGLRFPITQSHPIVGGDPRKVKSASRNLYSVPSNANAGTRGVHAIMAEGYRRAAARINRRKSTKDRYLPREVQSITWEQWRIDYPRTSRGGARGTMVRAEEILRSADADPSEWPPRRVSDELAKLRT
jgi:hypothetical protein